LRDIRRLAVDCCQNGAALVVEADFGVVVADAANGVLCDFAIVDVCFGGDFARYHDQPGRDQGFAGDARGRIVGQDGVENGIRYLVGNLVRMALGNRFRSE
jgi:hypothetical protein